MAGGSWAGRPVGEAGRQLQSGRESRLGPQALPLSETESPRRGGLDLCQPLELHHLQGLLISGCECVDERLEARTQFTRRRGFGLVRIDGHEVLGDLLG
jgi:hypothetical protein